YRFKPRFRSTRMWVHRPLMIARSSIGPLLHCPPRRGPASASTPCEAIAGGFMSRRRCLPVPVSHSSLSSARTATCCARRNWLKPETASPLSSSRYPRGPSRAKPAPPLRSTIRSSPVRRQWPARSPSRASSARNDGLAPSYDPCKGGPRGSPTNGSLARSGCVETSHDKHIMLRYSPCRTKNPRRQTASIQARKFLRPGHDCWNWREGMTIEAGERLPEATLKLVTPEGAKDVSVSEYFGGRKIVLFGVP